MARGYKELLDPDQSHDDSHQQHVQEIPSHEGHVRNEIELQDLLHTDPKSGLSSMQVHQRLRQFGPNQLAEVKTNQLLKFLTYFVGPIAFLIELACILSAIVQVSKKKKRSWDCTPHATQTQTHTKKKREREHRAEVRKEEAVQQN